MGFECPLTHGPDDMAELRNIVLNGAGEPRRGGGYDFVEGVCDTYPDDLARDFKLTRKFTVVCAAGKGTAAAFAPDLLRRIGATVVERHATLDCSFPHYNPNPEPNA